MNDAVESEMYASIGRAVLACQSFEFLFVACVKLVFKQDSVLKIDDVSPLNSNSFRPAITALLNELKLEIAIDPVFEEEIRQFSERRHTLVHRWIHQHGWPTSANQAEQLELTNYSTAVIQDAFRYSSLLATYLIKWMGRFPEFQTTVQQQELEWVKMLNNARLAFKIELA